MSVYSTQFWCTALPSGASSLYTVPAANTVVIRDIEVYNSSGGTVNANFQASVSGANAYIWVVPNFLTATWQQWKGRAVIPPGGILVSYCSVVGVQALISGYLLQ